MIHAYQEIYLAKAQSLLGEAFDYAVNACGIHGDSFVRQFVASTLCERLEKGDPAVLAGKSGIELAADIVAETSGKKLDAKPVDSFSRSAEYWIGWAAAYYQWWSGRKYSILFSVISFDELRKMYSTLHEADVTKFADIADARIKDAFPETNLKRIRTAYGCTQAELAEMAGVSLRSVQMYEQRHKDINKASVDTVYRLAKVLGCSMETLLER